MRPRPVARRPVSLLVSVAVAVPWVLVTPAPPASAIGAFTVTTTTDGSDADPSDGVCDDGTGHCTLRAAVEQANFDGGATVITLPAGQFDLNVGHDASFLPGQMTATIEIAADIAIEGAGPTATTIAYDSNLRNSGLFHLLAGSTLDLSSVVVTSTTVGVTEHPNGIVVANDHASLVIDNVLFDDLSGVGVAAWNVGATPQPSDFDILVKNSRFEGYNDFWNYSVLIEAGSGATVEVVNTVVNEMGYALLVDSDGSGNVLRVVDSTFTGNGVDTDRAMEIYDGFDTEIVRTSFSGHRGAVSGGRAGTLTVVESIFRNNSLYGVSVANDGTTIEDSSFIDNDGYAMDIEGPLTVSGTTISGNTGYGIAANFQDLTPEVITNTTITGNDDFGVALTDGSMLRNVTIVDNASYGVLPYGTVNAFNTVIAGNSDDCFSPGFIVGDHNADGDGSCGLTGTGDLSGIDPLLDTLADNGGPTATRAPLPESPLIDAGNDAECAATDQRGGVRPSDGDGDTTARCDIGAVEAGADVGVATTLAWSADPARRGLLAPDGDLAVDLTAEPGGSATAQIEAVSWYPGGDTGQPVSDVPLDVTIAVPLVESPPGTYTGTLPLAGIASISRLTAHVDDGGAGIDAETTDGLPVTVAGALSLVTAVPRPDWMLPTPRVIVRSGTTADGDSIVVPLNGATPTRWLSPATDYVAQLVDADHRDIAPPLADLEVRGGLITTVAVDSDAAPYVPFTAIIQDSNGAPLAGVKASVTDPVSGDEVAQLVTDADGRIEAVVRGDAAHVSADPLDTPYLPLEQDLALSQLGQEIGVSLGAALPTATISGTVSHPLRPAVPGVRVTFRTDIGERSFTTSTVTGEDGTYTAEVFQGSVTTTVDTAYVGRATDVRDVSADTTVDLLLEGPLMIDLDIDLQTRFAGEANAASVDIDWRVAVHHRLRVRSGGGWRNVSSNSAVVPLYPGGSIEVCADGHEVGLPAGCVDAVVDLDTQTATASLLLEQLGVVNGIMRWDVEEAGRPRPTLALMRVEPDGRLTAVWVDEPPRPDILVLGSFTQVGFSAPTPGPGNYVLVLNVDYETVDQSGATKFEHGDQLRVDVAVPENSVVDLGALEVPHLSLPFVKFAYSSRGSFAVGPTDVVPGQQVRLHLAAHNWSTDAAEDTRLRLEIPAGMTPVDGSVLLDGQPATSTFTGGTLEVNAGTIAPDQLVTMTAWARVDDDFASGGLLVSASVAHGVRTEPLGMAALVVRQLTIDAARTTSAPDLPVRGRALPGAEVDVYVDGNIAATAVATTGGLWRTTVTLPDVPLARSFTVSASAPGSAGLLATPFIEVLYDPSAPTLQSAIFRQSEGRIVSIDPADGVAEFPYVWVPSQATIVELSFDHPELIEDPEVWVGSATAPAVFDQSSGMWRAQMYPSGAQLGNVRANWTTMPSPIDLAPAEPQSVLTDEQARMMVPPELATFSSVTLTDPTPGAAAAEIEYPDFDETVHATVTTEAVTYQPTQDDLDAEAGVGSPLWGFSMERIDGSDGLVRLTLDLVIPDSALNLAAAPTGSGRLVESAPAAAARSMQAVFTVADDSKVLDVLWTASTSAGDGSGAILADEFTDRMTMLLDQADARCGPALATQFADDLAFLGIMYLQANALSAMLMILGLVIAPETLGLGTLAIWALTEATNRLVAWRLDAELERLTKLLDQQCPPPPPALAPFPERPPGPCAPEWNLVPPALGGPDCHLLADPTYIHDPSGFVYSVVTDDPLEGATATLESASSPGGPWTVWDAEWFGQSNPMSTDAAGHYGWDVPEGWWRVKYELDGYETSYSDPLEVLPPHFDVDANLRNLAVPAVDEVNAAATSGYVDVVFDQWMDVASIATASAELRDGTDSPIAATVAFPDERTSADGHPVARTVRLDIGRPLVAGEAIELELDRMIQSAGAVPLGTDTILNIVVAKAAQSIDLGPIADRVYGAGPATVSATATSGLPVAVSVTGPCSVAASSITLTGAGSCEVTASQHGDDQWSAAADVSTTFHIAPAPLDVTAGDAVGAVGSPPPALGATATGLANGDTLASLGGAICTSNAPTAGGVLSSAGVFVISCTGPSTPNYAIAHHDGSLTVSAAAGPSAVPLAPARLLETRPGNHTVDGTFEGIGQRAAMSITKLRVAGRGGVPADALAVMLNLTVIAPDVPGHATVYPCTPTPPNASNINYIAGQVVANGIVAQLDPSGDVCILTLARTHIVVDVNGYVPNGSGISTLPPARLLETRPGRQTIDGTSEGIGRRPAMSVTKVHIAGRGGVPVNATAALVNLTVVAPDAAGHATMYPCTPTPPNASNINYQPGVVVANSVVAKLDANGDVCVFTFAAAHILIDVSGYGMDGSGFETLPPARLLESRTGLATVDGTHNAIGARGAGSVTKVRVAGRGGVPDDALAAMLNLTIVTPDGPGHATIYPCSATPPNASNINYTPAIVVANGVFAQLDPNGDVCVFTFAASHVLIDVNGYLTG